MTASPGLKTAITCWHAACPLQPALILNFHLTLPTTKKLLEKQSWLFSLVYVLVVALVGVQIMAVWKWEFPESLRTHLVQMQMVSQTAYFALAAAILWQSYRRATIPIVRQQMKWISRGAV